MASLPSVEKTWFYNINNKNPTDDNLSWHQNLMFDIKKALINDSPDVAWIDDTGTPAVPAGIWSVDHSHGDGGLGVAGDGLDRWGSAASLIWDRPGDLHHWTVFNTGINAGAAQLMLDLDNKNTATVNTLPESIFAGISYDGDFGNVGAGGVAGTTGAAPIQSIVTSEITQGFTFGGWAGTEQGIPPDIAWHMMMSSDGEEMRIFYLVGGVCFGWWMVGVPAGAPASSTTNMHACIYTTNGLTSPLSALSMDGVLSRGFFGGGSNLLDLNRVVSTVGDGVAFPADLVKVLYLHPTYSINERTVWNADDLAGLADEREGEQVFTEIHLWDVDSPGQRGPKGRMKDVWIVKSDRQTGDTYPADGTRKFHQIGENVAVPWPPVIPENSF